MMNEIKKVKLADGLEKTTSWVWMEDGQLNEQRMVENFKSYFGIAHWLRENEIEFPIKRESWA